MALTTCLFCDRIAIINIYSDHNQVVHLCATHWFGYVDGPGAVIYDEVQKYFADKIPGDLAVRVDEILVRNGYTRKTDETQGDYKPTKKDKE